MQPPSPQVRIPRKKAADLSDFSPLHSSDTSDSLGCMPGKTPSRTLWNRSDRALASPSHDIGYAGMDIAGGQSSPCQRIYPSGPANDCQIETATGVIPIGRSSSPSRKRRRQARADISSNNGNEDHLSTESLPSITSPIIESHNRIEAPIVSGAYCSSNEPLNDSHLLSATPRSSPALLPSSPSLLPSSPAPPRSSSTPTPESSPITSEIRAALARANRRGWWDYVDGLLLPPRVVDGDGSQSTGRSDDVNANRRSSSCLTVANQNKTSLDYKSIWSGLSQGPLPLPSGNGGSEIPLGACFLDEFSSDFLIQAHPLDHNKGLGRPNVEAILVSGRVDRSSDREPSIEPLAEDIDLDPPLLSHELDEFFDEQRSFPFDFEHAEIAAALRMTSHRAGLAGDVLDAARDGVPVPSQRGIWCAEDDDDLTRGEEAGVERLANKHTLDGWGGVRERTAFLDQRGS